MAAIANLITLKQASKRLKMAESTLRGICVRHEIGQKYGPARFLSEDEIKQVEEIRKTHPVGRPRHATGAA